jgi:aspartate aminotransferase-like enzyme
MPGIIKERLFTPGSTPLLMEVQAGAMVANVHHRTEAFRQIMRSTLSQTRLEANLETRIPSARRKGQPGDRIVAGQFHQKWW